MSERKCAGRWMEWMEQAPHPQMSKGRFGQEGAPHSHSLVSLIATAVQRDPSRLARVYLQFPLYHLGELYLACRGWGLSSSGRSKIAASTESHVTSPTSACILQFQKIPCHLPPTDHCLASAKHLGNIFLVGLFSLDKSHISKLDVSLILQLFLL